jgi:SNF2 family DNA or RNA helicase
MTTTTLEYVEFLREKANFDHQYGVEPGPVNEVLKPHQRDIVQWAVRGGRRAIFASFGLGKSIMQLETLRLTLAVAGGSGLIVCPLGVKQEFVRDALELLGLTVTFVRRSDQVTADGIYITNYESVRDGKLDVNLFTAVSLDEASVLRSFGSKTYQTFLTLFDDVPYRFVATATPSPNRFKELIHYAGFLGVMDTGQALTRFFQRDSTKANNLTLYPHKAREFWRAATVRPRLRRHRLRPPPARGHVPRGDRRRARVADRQGRPVRHVP